MRPGGGRIETFVLGPLETNCHLLQGDRESWIVDPGLVPEPLLERLRSASQPPTCILLTHGHGDHIAGIPKIRAAFKDVRVLCPAADAAMLDDSARNLSAMFGLPIAVGVATEAVSPGETLDLPPMQWQVLDTSGHTPGGVSYYCPAVGVVITGDSLFSASIGRTDIPGGDAERLVDNIRRELLSLPPETIVLPGHGPSSTVRRERRENPFVGEG